MKAIITSAIFNYLQSGNYRIDYDYSGFGSKDDATIAGMIDLTEITCNDIDAIVEREYRDALKDLNKVTIADLVKRLSIDLCGRWIAKREDIAYGYSYNNKYFDGLRAGEATMFFIV